MSKKSRKVIITCAPTGAIHTPSMSAHLPVTAQKIPQAAIEAAQAGAAISIWGVASPDEARAMVNLKGKKGSCPMTQPRHFDLSGKTALITGASRGIGLATAFMLARQGAKVYLNARNAEELKKIAAQFQQEGLQGVPCPFDAFETQAGQVAIDQIIAESGRLDIVFLNAAIQSRAPLFEFKSEDFLRLVIGNLVSQWELGRYAARHMAQRETGRIIFTGSILALMGRENVSGYTASKAAIHGIIRQWSAELAPSGISVNGVAPGYVKTQLTSALHNDERFCAWLQSRTPMRRWARPEDIASAVTFLASDEAGFMTGQVLVVDGGLTSSLC